MIAILNGEPAASLLALCACEAPTLLMAAGTATEVGIVACSRWGEAGLTQLARSAQRLRPETIDVSGEHAPLAFDSSERFGRASGSAARLNFGDCFSYALAKSLDVPLLYVGEDFVHTDIRSAMSAA